MAVRATTVAIGAIGSVTAGAITKVAPKLGQIVTAEVIRGIRNTGRKINDACASDIQNRFNILYNKKHNNTNSNNRHNGSNSSNNGNINVNNGSTNYKQRIQSTREYADKYINGLKEKGYLSKRKRTNSFREYYEVEKNCEHIGRKFKKGNYLSRDTQHHEWELFSNKNTHEGAIEPINGTLYKKGVEGRTLNI